MWLTELLWMHKLSKLHPSAGGRLSLLDYATCVPLCLQYSADAMPIMCAEAVKQQLTVCHSHNAFALAQHL